MYRCCAAMLLIGALCSVTSAQTPGSCSDPLADLTSAKLEEIFDGLIGGGVEVPAAATGVADFAVSAAPIGARLLIDGKCHEVQRIVVAGFHEGPHGHGDIEREAGEDRGGELHRVASFQRRWGVDYQGESTEVWVDLTATVTIGEADPDGLDLAVSPASLCAGEVAEATATTSCGGCPVSGELVTFTATAGATVEPPESVTDHAGAARALVTVAEDREEVLLSATSEQLSASRTLSVGNCCKYWDLDATFDFLHDDSPDVLERYRSRVLFTPLALGNYVGFELCPAEEDQSGWMRYYGLRAEVVTTAQVEGTFEDDEFVIYDEGRRYEGSASGTPVWRFEQGPNIDEGDAACDADSRDTAQTVQLVFHMMRGIVALTWPDGAHSADGYLQFDIETHIDVDSLRACTPFDVELGFDDPGEWERATLRFTPAPRR